MPVWSLGQEDPLEKEMVTHSRILAWEISWTEEPGVLQSMGLPRVGHAWATKPLQDESDLIGIRIWDKIHSACLTPSPNPLLACPSKRSDNPNFSHIILRRGSSLSMDPRAKETGVPAELQWRGRVLIYYSYQSQSHLCVFCLLLIWKIIYIYFLRCTKDLYFRNSESIRINFQFLFLCILEL